MKILIIILTLILSAFPCKKSKECFRLVTAEKQSFAGGTKYSTYGTKYTLTVVPLFESSVLHFDSVLFKDRAFTDISLTLHNKRTNLRGDIAFVKNDTLILSFVHSFRPSLPDINTNVNNEETPIESGFPYQKTLSGAEAILIYSFKGKKRSYTIEKFTELAPKHNP